MTQLRWIRCQDVEESLFDEVVALEARSYPADEGASREQMAFRKTNAADFFWVATSVPDGSLAGFVNGTCTKGEKLEDETMSQHDAEGTTLCIHSVVVSESLRKQGLGRVILRRYLEEIVNHQPQIQLIVLLSKAHLVSFYESCGFTLRGASNVQHGQHQWFELELKTKSCTIACVNAFSDPHKRFSGNPAAVCIVPFKGIRTLSREGGWSFADRGLEDTCEQWMDKVAEQANLSETAFLRDLGRGEQEGTHRFELRWRTPTSEVDLCGHATLASAFALWDERTRLVSHMQGVSKVVFETRSGELFASRSPNGEVCLDFPKEDILPLENQSQKEIILEALHLDASDVEFFGLNRMDILVRVKSRGILDAVNPDLKLLATVETRAVSVTCLSEDPSYDFVSRLFGPRVGIDEDPFTGSSHCYLGPYWGEQLGKRSLRAYQASKRGGSALVTMDEENGRVILQGYAETAWCGVLLSTPFHTIHM